MADYRANAEDVEQDMADADVKIACPTLSLWRPISARLERCLTWQKVWAETAVDLRTYAIPQCGQLAPPEERPDVMGKQAPAGVSIRLVGLISRSARGRERLCHNSFSTVTGKSRDSAATSHDRRR